MVSSAIYSIDLDTISVTEAAAALADGRVSAEELMAAVLHRARQTEPMVHAYIYLDEDAAMDAARAADARKADGQPCGFLHGIPIGIKDMIEAAGMPTVAGSQVLAGNRPTSNADAVQRLRDCGALIVGMQWTHEFGCGMDVPPTRNAWDLTRYPGGSTAGGAVSVAVGSSLAALGADGGGSARYPAALNGLVGLKPTWGLVSQRGVIPGNSTTNALSPITRTVEDAALLLRALTGTTKSATGPTPGEADINTMMDTGVDGLRLGCPAYFFGRDVDPEIEDRTRRCLDALAHAGATIVEFALPELELVPIIFSVLSGAENYPLHARWLAACPDKYDPRTRRSVQPGGLILGSDVVAAQRARLYFKAAIAKAFADHQLDALCLPTVPIPAVPIEEMSGELLPTYTRHTSPFNLTGQPAISVPCGISADGMPIGFQIAGKPYDEAMVLRIARAVEHTGLWTHPRPEAIPRITSN